MIPFRRSGGRARVKGWHLLVLVALAAALAPPAGGQERRTEIVVGSEIGYPPFAIVDQNGEADGFSVDLMKAVGRVMGIEVSFRTGPWNEVRGALERGEIDALPLVSYSPERDTLFDFSTPHTMAYASVFKRTDGPAIDTANQLRGKSIAVMRADASHDWLLGNNLSENLKLTRTVAETLQALAAGSVDFALAPRLVGLVTAKDLGLSNIETTGTPIDVYGRGYGFAVKAGDAVLLSQLNQGLRIVRETGRYGEIYDKWFGVVDPRGMPTEVITRYVILAVSLFAAVLVALWILLLVGQNRSIKRRVDEATAELAQKSDLLKTVLESMSQAVIAFDGNLKLTAWNKKISDVRGYPPELLQEGRNFEDFMRLDVERAEFGPGDPEAIFNEKVSIARAFRPHEFERMRSDGTFIKVQGGPIPGGGFVSTYTDVSERTQALDAVRENEMRLQQILEHSPIAIAICLRDRLRRQGGR